jgi:TRAP-type C4-dicarboxylate transport system permease small subunit
LSAIDTMVGRLAGGLRLLGQAVLLFMMLSICYDVVMRYVFNAPTSWSLEVNSFLMVYLALIPAADVMRRGEQLDIGFIRPRFGMVGQTASRIITDLVGMLFCAVLAWRGAIMAYDAWLYGERMSTSLGTPMVIPFALLPIVLGLLCAVFMLDMANAVLTAQRPGWSGQSS